VTLNDPVYIEAAQALALRILAEAGSSVRDRAAYGFRRCVARPPRTEEVDRLVALYETELENFERDADAARKTATVPLGPAPEGSPLAEMAAWTLVGNVLLNLDEFLTKGLAMTPPLERVRATTRAHDPLGALPQPKAVWLLPSSGPV
jgi:hypothetical protein